MSDLITGAGITPASAGITGITNTIQKITPPVRPGQEEETTATLDQVKESPFGSIFGELIQNVKDTDAEFTQAQYLLSTGQLDNPATLSMALYKAEVATQLFVQVREKALNAYNELSRISL